MEIFKEGSIESKLLKFLLNNGFVLEPQSVTEYLGLKYVILYGYGKVIGFTSEDVDPRKDSSFDNKIKWDFEDDFNKWWQCNEIEKDFGFLSIVNILKQPKEYFIRHWNLVDECNRDIYANYFCEHYPEQVTQEIKEYSRL